MATIDATRPLAPQLVEQLRQRHPQAAWLALYASLAVRIDPPLLRRLRRRFGCGGAATEAELWFSPLVHTRAPQGIVLRDDVQAMLHGGLARLQQADGSSALNAAWAEVEAAHRHWPPILQLEERLAWLALGTADVDWAAAWQPVLAAMAASEERAREVARWAVRAVPRLPPRALASDITRMVLLAAVARVGGSVRALAGHDAPSAQLHWMLPANVQASSSVGTEAWTVEPLAEGLRLRPAGAGEADAASTLHLPRTRPPLVELVWQQDGQARSELRAADPALPLRWPAGVDAVELVAMNGQRWRVQRVGDGADDREQLQRWVVVLQLPEQPPALGLRLTRADGREQILTVAGVYSETEWAQVKVWTGEKGRGLYASDHVPELLNGMLRDVSSALLLLELPPGEPAPAVAIRAAPATEGEAVTVIDTRLARHVGSAGSHRTNGQFNVLPRPLASSAPLPLGAPVLLGEQVCGLIDDADAQTAISGEVVQQFLRWATRPLRERPPLWLYSADELAGSDDRDEAERLQLSQVAMGLNLSLLGPKDLLQIPERRPFEIIVHTVDAARGAVWLNTREREGLPPRGDSALLALRGWLDPGFKTVAVQGAVRRVEKNVQQRVSQGVSQGVSPGVSQSVSQRTPASDNPSVPLADARVGLDDDHLRGLLHHNFNFDPPAPSATPRHAALAELLTLSPDGWRPTLDELQRLGASAFWPAERRDWLATPVRALAERGRASGAQRAVDLLGMLLLGDGPWLTTLRERLRPARAAPVEQAPMPRPLLADLMPLQPLRLALALAVFPLPPPRLLALREQDWPGAERAAAEVAAQVAGQLAALDGDISAAQEVLRHIRTRYVVALMARPLPPADQLQQLQALLPGALLVAMADPSLPADTDIERLGYQALVPGLPAQGLPLVMNGYKPLAEIAAPRAGSPTLKKSPPSPKPPVKRQPPRPQARPKRKQ